MAARRPPEFHSGVGEEGAGRDPSGMQAFGKPDNATLDIHDGAHEVDLPAILKFFDEHQKH